MKKPLKIPAMVWTVVVRKNDKVEGLYHFERRTDAREFRRRYRNDTERATQLLREFVSFMNSELVH